MSQRFHARAAAITAAMWLCACDASHPRTDVANPSTPAPAASQPAPEPTGTQPTGTQPSDAQPPTQPTAVTDHVLDPARHAPGDAFGALRLAALEASPSRVESGGWIGSARFTGELTVSGRHGPHPAYPDLGVLCFFPDAASARRLPRFGNDQRYSWLCFDNQDRAVELLGPPTGSGTATIAIADVHYVFEHSDVNNAATLIRVER